MGNTESNYKLVLDSSKCQADQRLNLQEDGDSSSAKSDKTACGDIQYHSPPGNVNSYDPRDLEKILLGSDANEKDYIEAERLLKKNTYFIHVTVKVETSFLTSPGHFVPAYFAATTGNVKLLQLLVKYGADLFVIQNGYTLMDFACGCQQLEMIDFLTEQGLDALGSVNNKYQSSFKLSIKHGCTKTLKHLMEHLTYAKRIDHNVRMEALRLICVTNTEKDSHLKIIKYLVHTGCDVNGAVTGSREMENYGFTYLMYAACSNNPRILYTLYRVGAAMNAKTSFGDTALHLAAQRGNLHIVQSLLAMGADCSLRTKDHDNAVEVALINGYGKIALEIQRHIDLRKIKKLISMGKEVAGEMREGQDEER
jgi:ankyrin repeat protein